MISEQTHSSSITLTATNDFGSTHHCNLELDQGVFVGKSSNCGLQLNGKGLSDIHCRVDLEDGKLWVQDWMSAEGTRVNGESISTKYELLAGDVIQIGTHQIEVTSGQSTSVARSYDSVETENCGTSPSVVESEPVQEPEDAPSLSASDDETRGETQAETPGEKHGVEYPLDQVPDSIAFDASEHGSINFQDDIFELQEDETYDRETVALLRAEIEELQSALVQRDAEQSFDRTEHQLHGSPVHPAVEQSDEVLARMQDLIDEANRSDERAAILDEMLHASEEASRSEHEEREQLEAWVGDIEERVGQREDEHTAELEALRQRLDESNLQQERLQRQLRQAASSGSAPKHFEETLENLQASNKKLQDELAESQKQRLSLQQRLEKASDGQNLSLREERANIAKEQAKISRLRFELSSKLAAIEEAPKSISQPDSESAQRIQTLREHLREVHEEEKKEEREAPLTTRLARLWKRVEY